MAGKVAGGCWLGSSQLTPPRFTCHTPSIVGAWFSAWSLHTSKVLTATASVIIVICVLYFMFPWRRAFLFGFLCSSLLSIISCRSVSRRCLQDVFSGKGGRIFRFFPMSTSDDLRSARACDE